MHGYSFPDYEKGSMVRVIGRDVSISTKHSIEVCNTLRHRNIAVVKRILEDAIALKRPIPFKRYTNGAGHKPGMAAGQFPKNACTAILNLIKSLEMNAQHKGLNTSRLVIIHAVANKGARPYRISRQRGRRMKNTHLEFVAREQKEAAPEQRKQKAKQEKKGTTHD
ncbi:MAG: 50S ribosomal protein L22 [Candidatus Woesearchaeota archaeon]|nr:50S ribosomal protein L22 [Candidatus Woesearchaeota archaeon]